MPKDHLIELEQVLDQDEKARLRRYRSRKAQILFLVAHGLLRQTLSTYCPDVAPPQWAFATTSHGKPSLAPSPASLPRLQFNISHTKGLIACAFSTNRPLGIDVEGSQRDSDFLSLSKRFFAPEEHASLVQLETARIPPRFLSIWTLKEAYIKASGLGMTVPLDSFHFDFPTSSSITFTLKKSEGKPLPPTHDFYLLRPSPNHFASLAIERSKKGLSPLTIECFLTSPFSQAIHIATNFIATS